ncbi:MAG: hypothetical protein ACREJU_11220 [Nitrospiraceae bacterium]
MKVYDLRAMGAVLSLCGVIVMGTAGSAECQMGGAASPAQMVKGDVLDIEEGDVYVIKDITGHETRLHVNKETQMEDRIKVGDKIEAQVTSDGHVKSIRVHIPDGAPIKPMSPGQVP